MRKITIAMFSMLALAACTKVPAGNVGVKVFLLGGEKGVDSEILGPGRYWIGWNEDLFLFPTFTQNYTWTREPDETGTEDESLTFQTREGLSVNADVGISYSVRPEKVSIIFQKYRRGINEVTDIYLRNMVRDALVTYSSTLAIESVYGEGKAELMKKVEDEVRRQVDPIGINIERIYWIGNIRLPEVVTASLNAKIEATQRAQQRQNEVAEAKAEADKSVEKARGVAQSVLLEAKAQAEANKVLSESLTDELVRYKAIDKWDGSLPRFTGGQEPLPFIGVEGEK